MYERIPKFASLLVTSVAALILGFAGAVFRTDPGREAFTRFAEAMLMDVLEGNVRFDSIGGSFLRGLEVHNVEIDGSDGMPFVRIPLLTVRYRLLDVLSRRVVLGQVILERPSLTLYRRPGEPMNYEVVLGIRSRGNGNGGRPPLVAFRDAHIIDGSVIIRSPTELPGDGETFETEETVDGLMRVRRLEGMQARVSYVRLASPFPGESGLQFDIDSLTVNMTDPGLDIRRLEGSMHIDGSRLLLDLDDLRLRQTQAELRGAISWTDGRLGLDLNIAARRIAMNDLSGLVPTLPWNLAGSGDALVRTTGDGRVIVRADPLRLTGPSGGGVVTGRFEGVIADGGMQRLVDTRLRFDSLNLDYLRPLLDTIPVAGRLTGPLVADGRMDSLTVSVNWVFRDSLAGDAGPWPRSTARGSGVLALGGADGIRFDDFLVDSANVDLTTVRLLFPAVELAGRLRADGVLSGPWRQGVFAGNLQHRQDTLPETRSTGRMRWDSRGPLLGVWADLTFDSLHLAGIHPSYPSLPQRGVVVGRTTLAGYLDSLSVAWDVEGRFGRVTGDGEVVLTGDTIGFRTFASDFAGLALERFGATDLRTELFGRVGGSVLRDSTGASIGQLAIGLDTAYIADTPVDSGFADVRWHDGLFEVDRFTLWAPQVLITAAGQFGLDSLQQGTIETHTVIDSLETLEPLLRSVFPQAESRSWLTRLAGTSTVDVAVMGTLGAWETAGTLNVEWLESDSILVREARLEAQWSPNDSGLVAIQASVDTLHIGTWRFDALALDLRGQRSNSEWYASARNGLHSSFQGWGRAFDAPQVLILSVDSLVAPMNGRTWEVDPGALVSISDSGYVFAGFTVQTQDLAHRLTVDGLLPQRGSGRLIGRLEFLPVADVAAALQQDPSTVDGLISGTFDLQGTGAEPTFETALQLTNGRWGTVRVPAFLGSAVYASRRLSGVYSLLRSGDTVMTLTMDMPVDLALQPVSRRRLSGPLMIRAQAAGVDLSIVDLFTPNVRSARGTLDADVAVEGTWAEPVLAGSAAIVDGAANFPRLGVAHHSADVQIRLAGDTIAVERIRARSGSDGDISAQGFVQLAGLRQPILNLNIVANGFDILRVPGFLELTASGDVQLTGPVFSATLGGRGTVTEGVLYFADLIEKNVIDLEDPLYTSLLVDTTLINREGLGTDFENRFLDSLTVDNLRLDMGRSVWLRSNEANVQLAGQLQVQKRGQQYRYDGTLQTQRGTYRLPFAAKDFQVTGGEVRYLGTEDLNAAINIDARHVLRTVRDDNLTVFVNVGGTLYEPKLTLSSDHQPELPQTELISYLLFNAPSVGQVGAAGQQLELVAAQLAAGLAFGVVERALIADLGVPVDYLQIRPGVEISDYQLAVGWQLGRKTFLTLSPRVCDIGQNDLLQGYPSVEFRFSRTWRLNASVDPSTPCRPFGGTLAESRKQFGLDLQWDRRY